VERRSRSNPTPERVLEVVIQLGSCTAQQIQEELGAKSCNGITKAVERLLEIGWLLKAHAADDRVQVRTNPTARDRWWAAATLRRAYLADGETDLARFMSDEAYRWGRRMKMEEGNGDGDQSR